ncbi:MAG TPA: hypothetical protein VNX29_09515 [Kaistia sp.]|nr:hypothetical protein [Kaistia sp.]
MSNAPMRCLIADDEPFYHDWLVDYLDSINISVDFAVNIAKAIELVTNNKYRFIIADLSIPLSDKFLGDFIATDPAIREYPGLYIADLARQSGYRGKQVIVYSVHISETVKQYVDRLYCTYIPKGRPGLLKAEIQEIISFDPTAQ